MLVIDYSALNAKHTYDAKLIPSASLLLDLLNGFVHMRAYRVTFQPILWPFRIHP